MAGSDGNAQRKRSHLRGDLTLDPSSRHKPPNVLVARRWHVELSCPNDERTTDLGKGQLGAFELFEPLDQAWIEPRRRCSHRLSKVCPLDTREVCRNSAESVFVTLCH